MAVRTSCYQCGKDLGFHGAKSQLQFCGECTKKRAKDSKAGANLKLSHSGRADAEPIRYIDCVTYDECLLDAAICNTRMDCEVCPNYTPTGLNLNIMDYVVARSPIDRAREVYGVDGIWAK